MNHTKYKNMQNNDSPLSIALKAFSQYSLIGAELSSKFKIQGKGILGQLCCRIAELSVLLHSQIAFLHCVFSDVLLHSNEMPTVLPSFIGGRLLKQLDSSYWLHLFDFSPLCVFRCAIEFVAALQRIPTVLQSVIGDRRAQSSIYTRQKY